ncbi:MAG: hypothetical protein JRC53_04640 [Deltaproteobacteria bacterium]|nr:hypothetical protein [Deltaproteobacteria bacterium]
MKTGSDDDITVIDMHKICTVNADKFRSKGRNCPFNGWELKGKAVMTIVGGDVRYADSGL